MPWQDLNHTLKQDVSAPWNFRDSRKIKKDYRLGGFSVKIKTGLKSKNQGSYIKHQIDLLEPWHPVKGLLLCPKKLY